MLNFDFLGRRFYVTTYAAIIVLSATEMGQIYPKFCVLGLRNSLINHLLFYALFFMNILYFVCPTPLSLSIFI